MSMCGAEVRLGGGLRPGLAASKGCSAATCRAAAAVGASIDGLAGPLRPTCGEGVGSGGVLPGTADGPDPEGTSTDISRLRDKKLPPPGSSCRWKLCCDGRGGGRLGGPAMAGRGRLGGAGAESGVGIGVDPVAESCSGGDKACPDEEAGVGPVADGCSGGDTACPDEEAASA